MNIKKIRPLLNHIITTANIYPTTQADGELIGDEARYGGEFKEYQTVVAVGPNVTHLKEGDVIVINPTAYARPVHKPKEDSLTGLMTQDEVEMVVKFPIVTINGTPHLFLYDRDAEFVIENADFEDEDEPKDNENII